MGKGVARWRGVGSKRGFASWCSRSEPQWFCAKQSERGSGGGPGAGRCKQRDARNERRDGCSPQSTRHAAAALHSVQRRDAVVRPCLGLREREAAPPEGTESRGRDSSTPEARYMEPPTPPTTSQSFLHQKFTKSELRKRAQKPQLNERMMTDCQGV